MKRLVLLASSLLVFFLVTASPLHSSPNMIDFRSESVMSCFYWHIYQLIGTYRYHVQIGPVGSDREEGKVGGDADDYANGRGDGISDDKWKRDDKLKSGLIPGGTDTERKIPRACRH